MPRLACDVTIARIRRVAGSARQLGISVRANVGSFAPDSCYLLALLVPVALFDLTLSWLRITSRYDAPSGLAAITQLRSELLAHLGFAVLWIVAYAVLRERWRRAAVLVVSQLSVAGYLLFAVAAHSYYRKSGSILDAGGLRMMVTDPEATRNIAASESSTADVWVMIAAVTYALLGPVLVYRLRYRGQSPRGRWLPGLTAQSSSHRVPTNRHSRITALATTTGLLLVVAAAVPVTSGGAFARNQALGVALELGSSLLESERAYAQRSARSPSRLIATRTVAADRPRNVVMITMESVRSEATTLGNPNRDTTPFLAKLATRSTVAENAYTTVPHTSKAVTGANCGYMPPLDTKLTESAPAGLPSTCLPGLLRQQGYATAFLQSAVGEFERRPDLVRNLGYDEFFPVETFPTAGFGRANYFGWEDDIMLEPSRDWLRAQGDAPFLLTYLTVTGHHDYRLPGTFGLENLAEEEDLNNYLNGVRYVDRFVSKVFAMLAEEGRADDTLVVVTADHGEGFGEHGLRQHDNTIYNEGIKVPYLVYDPTDRRGRTVQRPVTTMSVPETVAGRLGYRLSGGLAREESLFGGGGGGGGGGGRPVRVSCQSTNRCLALIEGTTKYIHHFGNRPDEVFDLSNDPDEKRNLIEEVDPARLKALRSDLLQWRRATRSEYAPRSR